MARMSVVLPAPFGPSRPVTPGPNEQLSSDSATFWPNHTETSPTSTVASVTNAGSSAGSSAGATLGAGHGSGVLMRRMPVAGEQDHECGDEDDRVHDHREEAAVRDAGERALGVDVPEEDEVAQVQRQRQQVQDRDRAGAVTMAVVDEDPGRRSTSRERAR